jgi:hypothetical protein
MQGNPLVLKKYNKYRAKFLKRQGKKIKNPGFIR